MNDLQEQYLSCVSVGFLGKLGIKSPNRKQVELMGSVLFNALVFQKISFRAQLSKRQASCLYWAAMGKTSGETAEMLNIQPGTVEKYRKEVKKKLKCKSMAEAVFKGIQLGYLPSLSTFA